MLSRTSIYLFSLLYIVPILCGSIVGEVVCPPGFGSTLRLSDCELAISNAPSPDLPPSLFSDTNSDENFKIPYEQSSPNGRCHFGVSFAGNDYDTVFADWATIKLTAYAVLHQCVNRPDGFGWGGWTTVGSGHFLKVTLWEEGADDSDDEIEGPPNAVHAVSTVGLPATPTRRFKVIPFPGGSPRQTGRAGLQCVIQKRRRNVAID